MFIFGRKKKVKQLLELSDSELDQVIKIRNTDYDRSSKLTQDELKELRSLYAKGFTKSELAKLFNISIPTVTYRLDDEIKAQRNALRRKYRFNVNNNVKERAEYKRTLLKAGKIDSVNVRGI